MREERLTSEELDTLGYVRDSKLDEALAFLPELLPRNGAWYDSAPLRTLAAERGISRRALYEAANLVCVYARTPEFPPRTLWRLSDKALEWLEEDESEPDEGAEPAPEQNGDAVSRFVRLCDAKLEAAQT